MEKRRLLLLVISATAACMVGVLIEYVWDHMRYYIRNGYDVPVMLSVLDTSLPIVLLVGLGVASRDRADLALVWITATVFLAFGQAAISPLISLTVGDLRALAVLVVLASIPVLVGYLLKLSWAFAARRLTKSCD